MNPFYYRVLGVRALATLCLAVLLSACGCADIRFESPTQQAVFGNSALIDFDIRFVKAASQDATFLLNGTDVTHEFAVNTETGIATAQLSASTIADGRNRLEVRTPQVSRTLVFYVDRSGPEFHITNIDPWLMLPGVTVTFSGYVTDLPRLIKPAVPVRFRPH